MLSNKELSEKAIPDSELESVSGGTDFYILTEAQLITIRQYIATVSQLACFIGKTDEQIMIAIAAQITLYMRNGMTFSIAFEMTKEFYTSSQSPAII